MSNLTKKTKKELIDIILRKDDKELELNQIIDSKQATISSLEDELKSNKDKIAKLESDLSSKIEGDNDIISLQNKNKELNEQVQKLNNEIIEKNNELKGHKKSINELSIKADNYIQKLLEADEQINTYKTIIKENDKCLKHVKGIKQINNSLLIICFILTIALGIMMFL